MTDKPPGSGWKLWTEEAPLPNTPIAAWHSSWANPRLLRACDIPSGANIDGLWWRLPAPAPDGSDALSNIERAARDLMDEPTLEHEAMLRFWIDRWRNQTAPAVEQWETVLAMPGTAPTLLPRGWEPFGVGGRAIRCRRRVTPSTGSTGDVSDPTTIPIGIAINLRDTAHSLADDAHAHAENPSPENAAVLLASMRIMRHRLDKALRELGLEA